MAIFPTCDVAGCENPAIVGPVTFALQSYTSAINSWSSITYTTDVDRRYCYEHSPTTEAERLRAFVRTIADGWPQEDAPAHVTAIFIDSLRSEAQRLLAASSVAHPDANKG